MVAVDMAWFSASLAPYSSLHNKSSSSSSSSSPKTPTLGILAFDVAKIMSRLLSLYNSLSDDELNRLRTETIPARGVAYLNSSDHAFLFSLAFNERLEDLNHAAIAISVIGRKCSDSGLNGFDLVCDGGPGPGAMHSSKKLEFGSKQVEKLIEKTKKLVSATSQLYSTSQSLDQLEQSGSKVHRWNKNNVDPKQCGKIINLELFNQKQSCQRKQVQQYRNHSLWNHTFDGALGLMARLVCVVYARLYAVFFPYSSQRNPLDPLIQSLRNYCLLKDRKFYHKIPKSGLSNSGPIPKSGQTTSTSPGLVRFASRWWSPALPADNYVGVLANASGGCDAGRNNSVFRLAPQSTVGGCGLTLRYANVIVFAETCLYAPATIRESARHSFYEMLPARLKAMVGRKLRRLWRDKENQLGECDDGHSLARGWSDALEEIMEWLTPLAHDTLKWQSERNLEKQRFDVNPTVLLLQTLHYSDLEKTEAAIVEVLVGLSFIYTYEHRPTDPFLRRR